MGKRILITVEQNRGCLGKELCPNVGDGRG